MFCKIILLFLSCLFLVGCSGEAGPPDAEIEVEKEKHGGIEMCEIPSGTFLMGAAKTETDADNDEVQHEVSISALLISKNEITQAQFKKVMGFNPSYFSSTGAGSQRVEGVDTSHHPVEDTSWFDCARFCNRLSELEGLKPCYLFTDEEIVEGKIMSATITFDGDADGYRLPSEAEWEYACRAGTTTTFAFGDTLSPQQANFDLDHTVAVGSYTANKWGLCDMHGNVNEWCHDIFESNYHLYDEMTDPMGPLVGSPPSPESRSWRGGSADSKPKYCRSAARSGVAPYYTRQGTGGFRIAIRPNSH